MEGVRPAAAATALLLIPSVTESAFLFKDNIPSAAFAIGAVALAVRWNALLALGGGPARRCRRSVPHRSRPAGTLRHNRSFDPRLVGSVIPSLQPLASLSVRLTAADALRLPPWTSRPADETIPRRQLQGTSRGPLIAAQSMLILRKGAPNAAALAMPIAESSMIRQSSGATCRRSAANM